MHHTIDAVTGKALGVYLQDTDCPVAVLKVVKAYSAKCSRDATEDSAREVATVVYYAAIAAARVRGGETITAFSLAELRGSFAALAALSWLTTGLKTLFVEALETCQTAP